MVAVIVAGACTDDDETSAETGPTEAEIEAVQRSFCEIYAGCGNLNLGETVEDCVETTRSVYAFSEECFELRFASESCMVDAVAEIEATRPDADICYELWGRFDKPCAEERAAADTVNCNG